MNIESNGIPPKVKSKRGRKPKNANILNNNNETTIQINEIIKEGNSVDENCLMDNIINETTILLDSCNITDHNIVLNVKEPNCMAEDSSQPSKPPQKKRGRKPKGGKIVSLTMLSNDQQKQKPNIILHLRCSLNDLKMASSFNENIESYIFSNNNHNNLNFELINNTESNVNFNTNTNIPINNMNMNNISNITSNPNEKTEDPNTCFDSETEVKEIWKKLKQLEHNLHVNNINDKKSACFWCTYDFDNPPIYIPKFYIKDSYHVYGCFCSPECSVAYLTNETIDTSTKFERYHHINHIYGKIYNYKKNIKPAPNPYYMLDKYYGNLSIQEYRSLLKNDRLFLIVDKPLTKILPELHEDNDDFILNSKIIPSNNFQIKKKLQKKNSNKTNILNEQFGVSQ